MTYACEESGKYRGNWTINPNGDSELALLMRDMYDDAMVMKIRIKEDKKPKVSRLFEELHTADATEPDKVATEEYTIFSNAYQESLATLKKSAADDVHDSYQGMVQSCMNCHQVMCPGPMVKIEKLYLNSPE